jgi:hypothetical protein
VSRKRLNEGTDSKKIVLSLSFSEGGCCSLADKHDRRKASIAKLLSLDRRSQKQMSHPQQTGLGLIPKEDRFCRLETEHIRRMASRLKLLVSLQKLQKQGP